MLLFQPGKDFFITSQDSSVNIRVELCSLFIKPLTALSNFDSGVCIAHLPERVFEDTAVSEQQDVDSQV
jgi:hypothetical protein